MPKLKEDLMKIWGLIKLGLNYIAFLKPTLISSIIAVGIMTVLIIGIVFTTRSICEINRDTNNLVCEDTTLTGLAIKWNILGAVIIAYILASVVMLLYNKYINKSYLK
ncbi:MAG: hypothetical protein KKG59_04880 [Nanoarchaeota archaeon]|nr:hypothetical protein [Nanoarchaeota archaeon]